MMNRKGFLGFFGGLLLAPFAGKALAEVEPRITQIDDGTVSGPLWHNDDTVSVSYRYSGSPTVSVPIRSGDMVEVGGFAWSQDREPIGVVESVNGRVAYVRLFGSLSDA